MSVDPLIQLTAAIALVAATAAGCFALLLWRILHRSPFGRAVGALTAAMVVLAAYHVLVLTLPEEPTGVRLVRSATYTVLLVVILLVIRTQRRMRDVPEGLR